MTNSRAVRALTDITAVENYAPGMARVVSWSDEYILDLRGEGCACPDKEYNDTDTCKHEYAAMLATTEYAPTPYVSETRERTSPEVCTHSPGELPCFECYDGRDSEVEA